MFIPEKIHTVWIGNNEIPEKEKQLIEKNKSIVSNYEYIIWNNDNYKELLEPRVEPFINKALENKKYAFVSDCLKLLALKKFGGWAIDADVEIFQPFKLFEHLHWVSGFESYGENLSPITATWGAIPDHHFTIFLLEFYSHIGNYDKITSMPNTRWISWLLYDNGVRNTNDTQYVPAYDVTLLPDYVFCNPFNGDKSYTMHHFSGSWLK